MRFQYKKQSGIAIISFFFLIAPLSTEALKTIKTTYFDIIYTAESKTGSALLLAKYADGFADEISARLHKKITQRIPVYLFPDTETLNGYYTCMPYRRIVLYDTEADDGLLAHFDNTILNVFYHELTHAISLQSPLDYLIPFSLFPLSFTEGAAVSFESLYGYGRLNDPLARHYIIQHKIDGESPSWKEAAGHSDMYPGGILPYIYGGFFAQHLQKNYGNTAYAQLWHLSPHLFIPSKFRTLYKTSLETEWNRFLTAITVPQTLTTPQPFSDSIPPSGYTVLASSPEGYAYYDFDKHAVYFFHKDSCIPEKLFAADNSLHHISFSPDGTILTVSDTEPRSMVKRSRLFDMKQRAFTNGAILSSRGVCVINATTLCAIFVKDHVFSAALIDSKTYKVKKILYKAGSGERFSALYSPCTIEKDTVAFIAANGIKRTIIFVNINSGIVQMLPETDVPAAIRYMQAVSTQQGTVLSFSWADKNMLYRLGLYYPKSGILKLQKNDISGGVFFPVVLPFKKEELSVIYVGMHRRYHKLYTFTKLPLKEKILTPIPCEYKKEHVIHKNRESIPFQSTSYNPAEWLGKIWMMPNISIPDKYKDMSKYGTGLFFVSQDPAEKIKIKSSFLLFRRPLFLHGDIHITAKQTPVSVTFNLSDKLDTFLFSHRRTLCGMHVHSSIPLRYSRESIDFNYTAHAAWIGFPHHEENSYYTVPYRYTQFLQEAELSYQHISSNKIIKRPLFSKKSQGGILAFRCAHSYCLETTEHAVLFESLVSVFIPVVPIKISTAAYLGINTFFNRNTQNYTQLQSGLTVSKNSYLPAFKVYRSETIQNTTPEGLYGGCSILCDITLFSYDIQTGSFFLPLFYNRIGIHAGYAGVFTGSLTNTSHVPLYFDTVYTNILLTVNALAQIGIEYTYPVRIPASFGKIQLISQINL